MPELRLIAGSGRSGTTWVLDALAIANDLRPVFEPLNPHVSDIGAAYAHRALAPQDCHDELLQFYREVCAGRRERLWTQYRRQGRWLLPPPSRLHTRDDAAKLWKEWQKFLAEVPRLAWMSTRREPLVKCIWSNLMLGWLSRNLPCRIALVVRHPGAVIESELRSGWNTKFAVERFRSDRRLGELTGGRYGGLLERRLSPVQELAVRWIIENQVAIESAASSMITIAYYEQLKRSDGLGWQVICNALNLAIAPGMRLLQRPSQQAAPKDSDSADGMNAKPRWMASLSDDDKVGIQEILDQAEFDIYRMDNAVPRLPAATKLPIYPGQIAP